MNHFSDSHVILNRHPRRKSNKIYKPKTKRITENYYSFTSKIPKKVFESEIEKIINEIFEYSRKGILIMNILIIFHDRNLKCETNFIKMIKLIKLLDNLYTEKDILLTNLANYYEINQDNNIYFRLKCMELKTIIKKHIKIINICKTDIKNLAWSFCEIQEFEYNKIKIIIDM